MEEEEGHMVVRPIPLPSLSLGVYRLPVRTHRHAHLPLVSFSPRSSPMPGLVVA